MYSELWSPRLRQGDVLGPLHLPLVGRKQEVIAALEAVGSETGGAADRMIVPAARRHVVVVSHDCEFNEAKRDRLLLARVQSVPQSPGLDFDALRASNDIDARHAAGAPVVGVDNFVLDPLPEHFEEPQVVVFTTVTPYPAKNMLAELQRVKQAELLHSQRLLLRRKLAWFFLRGEEDVDEAEKRPAVEVRKDFGQDA